MHYDSMYSPNDLPGFNVMRPGQMPSPMQLTRETQPRLPDGTPIMGPDGFLIPPARDFATIVNAVTRLYSYRFDEAMRDSIENSRSMLRDGFIRGQLNERWTPTINRKWQLKVDNTNDPRQKMVRDGLTRAVKRIKRFDQFRRANLMGEWWGRGGTTWKLKRDKELGGMWGIRNWDAVHGDSIQFTFDGVPAILMDTATAQWYTSNGATVGPNGDVRATDRGGMALVLQRPYWRDRYSIHQWWLEKADYFEGELAGSVQGLGLRGVCYWQYSIRTDALAWMLGYMQSVGQMDLLVFNYRSGNAADYKQQQLNARKIIGKAVILCPRPPESNFPPVETIPMNESGLKALHELVSNYFDRHIKCIITGQVMGDGGDMKGGLGDSGRAAMAMSSKDEILVSSSNALDATITDDVITVLKKYNYPWADFPVEFESILPDPEKTKKVEAGTKLIAAGVAIKADEFREAGGFTRPEPGDEICGGPTAMGPGQGPGGAPGGPGQPAAGGPSPFSRPAPQPLPSRPRAGARPTMNNAPAQAMGYPGGGNAYVPAFQGGNATPRNSRGSRFGNRQNARGNHGRIGFTRFDRWGRPLLYAVPWDESKHKRGQPKNKGQFGPGGGGGGGSESSSGGAGQQPAQAAPPQTTIAGNGPMAPGIMPGGPVEGGGAAIAQPPSMGEQFQSRLFADIDSTDIHREDKARYKAAISRVLSNMTPLARERAAMYTRGGNKFYPNQTSLNIASANRLLDSYTKSGYTAGIESAKAKLQEALSSGGTIMAVYDPSGGGSLHLDGLKPSQFAGAPGKATNWGHGETSDFEMHGLYAHEMGHAVDGPNWEHSGSREWQQAFKKEIMKKRGKYSSLSGYATTNAQEGFAEFSRLVYSGEIAPDRIRQLFPMCSQYFESRGLWGS